ncbi:MAG: glycosyltransferase family 9 protein [bacterium]
MIKTIFAKIIGWTLRIMLRLRDNHPPINIINQLNEAKNILVYMPHKIEHFGVALQALQKLITKRPHWHITVITKREMVSIIDNRLKVNIIPFSNEDINFFGFPKESLKKYFNHSSYDLALDFLFKFDLLIIKLFQLSGAPLKVCFDSKEKSHFYNFRIRVSAGEELAKKYNAMIKYITVMEYPTKQASPRTQTPLEFK